MPKVAAVIPAGGVGARFGARTPKQFLRLGRLSILAATVRHFARHPAVRAVVVAAPQPWVARADRKSTRLNSSHCQISYADFCLKNNKSTPPLSTRQPSGSATHILIS